MVLIEMRMEIVNVNGEAETNVGEHLISGVPFSFHWIRRASRNRQSEDDYGISTDSFLYGIKQLEHDSIVILGMVVFMGLYGSIPKSPVVV